MDKKFQINNSLKIPLMLGIVVGIIFIAISSNIHLSSNIHSSPPKAEEINTFNNYEAFTLHKGEYWFTDRSFKVGEKYRVRVEYASLKLIRGNGSSEIISPGEYEWTTISAGQTTFQGINKLSKVTVMYKSME
jgi:hypothetical protein